MSSRAVGETPKRQMYRLIPDFSGKSARSRYDSPMHNARLPDGFGVRVEPTAVALSGGRVLVGGVPKRMLRLAPAAAEMIGEGYLRVTDARTAGVARTLLDSGLAHPRPMSTPSVTDISVVIPVRNNAAGVDRLLRHLRGLRVVDDDDGSDVPLSLDESAYCLAGLTVVRHERSRGPAAARNTGFARVEQDFVAFLDSDVVPRRGWLEVVSSHFSDPTVAMVAPRIVGYGPAHSQLARYEQMCSSLDLGRHESMVRPGGRVPYVPSAAVVVRAAALREQGGFEESMHVGEDVDLCWRMQDAGWRLRYEPVATVEHEHRIRIADWFSRRVFYGTSTATLATRHPGKVPPLAMSRSLLATAILVLTLSKIGLVAAAASMVLVFTRLRSTFADVEGRDRLAAQLAVTGVASAIRRVAIALVREYWPATLLAMLLSARVRQTVVTIAIVEGLVDWFERNDPMGPGPIPHLLYRRLADLAYGAGLWQGVIAERDTRALRPVLQS